MNIHFYSEFMHIYEYYRGNIEYYSNFCYNNHSEANIQMFKGVFVMSDFIKIDPKEITDNPFKLIGSDWGLVTSGDKGAFNTMTISWGGVGILWNKPVAYTFIRPQRYTYEFLEKNSRFTISFFDEEYRKALSLCGSKSGRDIDKVEATGLTPAFTDSGAPYFEEARLVLVCKKLYAQDFNKESVIDEETVLKNYGADDWHRMYISEITEVLRK